MRRAVRSAPLATTRGAPMVASSYFNATAKWVGFMTTRSASGTAANMRRLASSRMRAFRRALTSALPSISLYSFFISSTLMRSRRNNIWRCNGTSTSAKTASTPPRSSSPPRISSPPAARAAGSGMASSSAWLIQRCPR